MLSSRLTFSQQTEEKEKETEPAQMFWLQERGRRLGFIFPLILSPYPSPGLLTAFKGKRKPTERLQLFFAPLFKTPLLLLEETNKQQKSSMVSVDNYQVKLLIIRLWSYNSEIIDHSNLSWQQKIYCFLRRSKWSFTTFWFSCSWIWLKTTVKCLVNCFHLLVLMKSNSTRISNCLISLDKSTTKLINLEPLYFWRDSKLFEVLSKGSEDSIVTTISVSCMASQNLQTYHHRSLGSS